MLPNTSENEVSVREVWPVVKVGLAGTPAALVPDRVGMSEEN